MVKTRDAFNPAILMSVSTVCLATVLLGLANAVEGSVENVLVSIKIETAKKYRIINLSVSQGH